MVLYELGRDFSTERMIMGVLKMARGSLKKSSFKKELKE